MENNTKGNYWTIIIFLDNMEKVPDWRERLCDTHMRFCISPYHDKDVWKELDIEKHPEREKYIREHLGEPKTPHYHVLFHCDTNTTFKTMKELTTSLGLPIPFIVRSPYGMYRYLTHEDDPDKHKYSPNDIKHYNGSAPDDYIMEISKLETTVKRRELMQFMRTKRFIKMFDFLIAVPDNFSDPRYEYIAQTNILFFREILKDNLGDMSTSIMAKARKMQ